MPALANLLGCLLASTATAGADLDFSKMDAVIAGVLHWKDKSLATFDARHRKDQELFEVLGARGVPEGRRTLLLDEKATRQAILDAVAKRAAAVPEGGTFVLYYAGHGLSRDDGSVYFASFDIDAKNPRKTGLALSDLAPAIAKGFKGARVLLLADCCYSGALQRVAAELSKKGIAAAAVTSADASNTSTANWTFSQTLLDVLRGDPLADRDRDGGITLAELSTEVADAMKHRERQRSGSAVPASLAGLRLAARAAPIPAGDPAWPPGSYLQARAKGGRLEAARVRASGGGTLTVETFRYADKATLSLAAADTLPMTFLTWPAGSDVLVTWGGRKYPAKVLKVEDGFHLITYPGWSASWNEWVMDDRISVPSAANTGSRTALVEWNGDRYPAIVLAEKGGKFLVHYVNYDNSWDEWVGPERLSSPPPTPAEAPEAKVGDAVQVEWKGGWYKAMILAVDGKRVRVHYDGFESSWDEWVGPERVRR